jgi:aspartyl-tRNA(Asn)/glutamyl-tRNA(Gln) amidotransferase subunit A
MSAVENVAAALQRIQDLNASLNAFISVFEEQAMAQARLLDAELRSGGKRGPLHGRPISIKDIIDVAGTPTTAASRVRLHHLAHADATVVTRLRRAGAVIIGKCNLHEFALGTTNEESAFGPARNPYDPDRSPGGSSGGSAAAVAAEMGWASIGTDTGGSIRIPGAACGVVGLKPTFGEVPTTGVVPLSVSLDHVGPLARSVKDAWALHAVLTEGPPPRAESAIGPSTSIRLGVLGGYFMEKLDVDVRAQFDAALHRLRAGGVSTDEKQIERTADIAVTYANVVLPEAAAYHARALQECPHEISSRILERLKAGHEISRDDYMKAQQERGALRREVDAALADCDALVLPTLAIPAPRIGTTTVRVSSGEEAIRPLSLRLTQLFNLTGHPAITLPCGTTRDGLPCGLQLVGRIGETTPLLDVALRCEDDVSRR